MNSNRIRYAFVLAVFFAVGVTCVAQDVQKVDSVSVDWSDGLDVSFGVSESTNLKDTPNSNGQQLVDVYMLDGVLVKRQMAKSELDTLPKGIYIIGGRKFAMP